MARNRGLAVEAASGAPRGFRCSMERLKSAVIAADLDEYRQAILSIRIILGFFSLLTAAYLAFYAVVRQGGALPLQVNAVALVVYLCALWLANRGLPLAAAVLGLGAATVHLVVVTGFFGWSTGFHLYLGVAGQLVFMMFTDRQKWWRVGYLIAAPAAFVYCQFSLSPEAARFELDETVRSTLFALNAIVAGLLVFALAAVAHERAHIGQRVAHEAAARAEYLANTDALTGLVNRRPVMLELDRLARPDADPYCLAIADLDGFKALNDTFGHACGDKVLAAVGRTLRASVRGSDLVGRWGGEEFIFLLPDSTLADANVRAERVRAAVDDLVIDCSGHAHTITMSVGVADGVSGIAAFRVLKRADDAMYDAKKAGRNTVRSRGRDAPRRARRPDSRSLRIRGSSE